MKHPLVFPAGLVVLVLLSAWVPGPLYLVSLALFGLPHVVWELAFLRSRYQGRWPVGWLTVLAGALLLQATLRAATWLGAFSAEALQVADLLVLGALFAAVVAAPQGTGWPVRAAALVAGLAVMAVLQGGHWAVALLVLAMAHNFTPVGLAWDLARTDPGQRRAAWRTTAVFLLPVGILALGAMGLWPGAVVDAGQAWLKGPVPPSLDAVAGAPAWASAMALAQCLHYHWVLREGPAAEQARTGRAPMSGLVRQLVLATSAALALYFAWDFADARQLYAVAAGLHAWLEWPVLLMVLLAPRSHAPIDARSTRWIRS